MQSPVVGRIKEGPTCGLKRKPVKGVRSQAGRDQGGIQLGKGKGPRLTLTGEQWRLRVLSRDFFIQITVTGVSLPILITTWLRHSLSCQDSSACSSRPLARSPRHPRMTQTAGILRSRKDTYRNDCWCHKPHQ